MSLEEFNFDSLVMSSMDDKSGKPPIQPSPNLVNIGPFSIPKLNIPDGFYTNPATWSKSSTGSGHTEHEEDSYKVERDVRMEYLSSFQDNRFVSPSIAFNEQHEDMRTYNSGANRFHQEHSFHSQISSGEVSLGSSRTTPTNASANVHTQEKLHQMQLQQKLMQVHESTGYHSKTPSPRGLYQNLPQLSPAHSVPRSPHAYEYDGNDFTSYTDSRVIARSNMPHYTPSAAISAAAWRPSVAPATASSMQLRTTPTNASTKFGSTPPASPSTGYHSGYNQAAQGGVNGLIYQVQFKCALRNYILGSQAHPNIMMGDFVVVEADRGEDIGVVVEILPMKTFVERRIYMKNAVDDENVIGRILRLASVAERQFLPEKFHDEENIVQFCRELAYSTYRLPMMIHDVEYQFDRHKLTIFYSSDSRVDFREFVRDLFSAYKARIWMKKIGTGKPVRIDNWASVALATGMQFSPDNK